MLIFKSFNINCIFIGRLFLFVSLLFAAVSCTKQEELRLDFFLGEGYDSMSIEIRNLNTDEVLYLNTENRFTHFVSAHVGDFIEVKYASFRQNSTDTISFGIRTIEISQGENSWMINPMPSVLLTVVNQSLNLGNNRVEFEWPEDYYGADIKVYVSEDSATIFNEENIVANDVYSYVVQGLEPMKYIAVKSSFNFGGSYYESRKSAVYPVVNYPSLYRQGVANEWIEFKMNFLDYLYWRIPVKKGSWYKIEAYDMLNDQYLTGKELVLFERENFEIRTRNPDGCPYFFIAEEDVVTITAAIGYGGNLGSVKFRVLEISPDSESDIEDEHVFTENAQVLYAKQDLPAGTHLIKTYQADILNEAFVYYSFVVNGEIAQIEEFSSEQLGSNMGPNSREDTTVQFNYITLDQASTVQMIMMNCYHNNPASLFVEIN